MVDFSKIGKRRAAVGSGVVGAVAIAAVLAGSFEGERHRVYRDIVGVPTYCIGETKNPNWNKVYTHEECVTIFEGRLTEFAEGVQKCVKMPLSDTRLAAFTSLSYNIGIAGFCRSSVVRLQNSGHEREACDAMRAWNHAGGKVVYGLTRRREAERKLCLEDVK